MPELEDNIVIYCKKEDDIILNPKVRKLCMKTIISCFLFSVAIMMLFNARKISNDYCVVSERAAIDVPGEVINVRDKAVEKAPENKAKKKKAREAYTVISRGQVSRMVNYQPFGENIFTAEDYNRMLEDTGLEECGKYFKYIEIKNDVNGLFGIAVAMHESARGRMPLPGNNYFGMIGMKFDNKKDNIYYFGKLLSGRLYKGSGLKTIDDVNSKYCVGDTWSGKVKVFMKEMASKSK